MTTIDQAERDRLRALCVEVTPLPDTGHGQACGCFECAAVWLRGAGLAEDRAEVTEAMPLVLDALEDAEREAAHALLRVTELQARLEVAMRIIYANRPPMEPKPAIGIGPTSVRELADWLAGGWEGPDEIAEECRVRERLEAAGLMVTRGNEPTALGAEMLATLPPRG
jgi:hypothetical protein